MQKFEDWILEQNHFTTIVAFRGCRKGEDYFNVPDIVTNNPSMDICWSTSSFLNSQFYEDGEIQIIKININRPFIVDEQDCIEMRKTQIIDEIKLFNHFIEKEKLQYDCVIFKDIIDGSHPSNIYAMLNEDEAEEKIERIGTITYDKEGEMSLKLEENFNFLEIDLNKIDRVDEITEQQTNKANIKDRINIIKRKYTI